MNNIYKLYNIIIIIYSMVRIVLYRGKWANTKVRAFFYILSVEREIIFDVVWCRPWATRISTVVFARLKCDFATMSAQINCRIE